jgi:hypothetical protein
MIKSWQKSLLAGQSLDVDSYSSRSSVDHLRLGHGLGGGLLVLVPEGRQKNTRGGEQDATCC